MKKSMLNFAMNNYPFTIAVGFALFLGGIALAYLTNDAELWGTIGGWISGLSLFLIAVIGSYRSQQQPLK